MTQIKRVDGLGSPAAIKHDGICRKVLVDRELWSDIPAPQRRFIILHELAHCKHNVFSEVEADEIAFREFIAEGGHPQDAIDAIADNLPGNPGVPGRIARINQLMTVPMCEQCANKNNNVLIEDIGIGDVYSALNGKNLKDVGASAAGSASQGTQDQSSGKGTFWTGLEAVATTVGNIFGQRPRMYSEPGYTQPPAQNRNITGWLIGGGVVVLLVVLFVVSKAKK